MKAHSIRKSALTSLLCAALMCFGNTAFGIERIVADPKSLLEAIRQAEPGDVITLGPGIYRMTQKISVNRSGTRASRILVRARKLGDVLIQSNTAELFKVSAPYWTFANLEIEGVCASHSRCDHAFHIVAQAHSTTVQNNSLRNLNAAIKGNGENVDGIHTFPDDVRIIGNKFYNTVPRDTGHPTTPIDVVGGRRWKITGNYIADFGKENPHSVSYGAFLKGHSKEGVFEGNLVVCALRHSSNIRVGLSFGDGGSHACGGKRCAIEHTHGTMRNNIVMNCNDVGIYLSKAKDSKIYHNLLYNTGGIDVRYNTSTADIANNILSGSIRDRNGATHRESNNLVGATVADFYEWFIDPGAGDFALQDGAAIIGQALPLGTVTDDFCFSADRTRKDLGPFEHGSGMDCSTRVRSLFESL